MNCSFGLLALTWLLVSNAHAADSGTGASFKGPVGLQLYSLRGIATQNPPKALKQAKDFGLTLVETAGTYTLPPAKFKALLELHGLKPISGHFPMTGGKPSPRRSSRRPRPLACNTLAALGSTTRHRSMRPPRAMPSPPSTRPAKSAPNTASRFSTMRMALSFIRTATARSWTCSSRRPTRSM